MRKVWIALLLVWVAPAVWAAQDLLQTYDQALRNDTELASAEVALGAANARYRQARGQLLPQLSLQAGYTYVERGQTRAGVADGSRSSVTLNVSQALFNWTAWQSMDAAEARSERARVLLSAAEQALIVRTTQAYFEVLAARDVLKATHERLEAIRQQLQRAQAAFQAGLAPVTDRLEAQSSLDAAQVDAIAARNRVALARQELRMLTGQAPQQLAGIGVHEPVVPPREQPRSRQAWLELAMQNALLVDAAQIKLAAAQEQIDAARGQRYPDIAVVGSVGRTEQLLPRGAADTWTIGVQLEMPLFAGGSIAAAVDEATFAAAQARLDLVEARRQLRLDVNSAWRSVRAAADRVAALDQAVESAKAAVAAAQAGYRLGNRTILDVIEAETELAQRKAERKQAWYDYALARLQLRQAAGVLDYTALARINEQLSPPDADESTDMSN